MQIHIGAIGRLKNGPEKQLAAQYFDRVKKSGRAVGITGLDIKEYPESQNSTDVQRKAQEAEKLLAGCPPQSVLIVLDEFGKDDSSVEFSTMLAELKDGGTQSVSFLIGGPDGHDAQLLEKATRKMAMGKKTWPHRLVRIMLAEQIYRAITIMQNHPYHRA